ncbi:MAG: DUF3291 domain-containing protein, partial [Anaerolineae bacterium]|nr:DUF3291 domain-containing protein [Anaerolineae bacterium]
HASFLRRRREWFQHMAEASLALWWVPVGHIPTMAEAVERLTHVQTHGPTPFAFTFRQPFPPPGASEPTQAPENARCPVEGWRSPPPATRWHRG